MGRYHISKAVIFGVCSQPLETMLSLEQNRILSTLKQKVAYNVAKCISKESGIQNLHIPTLNILVSMLPDTYSGDYMCVSLGNYLYFRDPPLIWEICLEIHDLPTPFGKNSQTLPLILFESFPYEGVILHQTKLLTPLS